MFVSEIACCLYQFMPWKAWLYIDLETNYNVEMYRLANYILQSLKNIYFLLFHSALRIHISEECYRGLCDIGGYEMTSRGEINIKVGDIYFDYT